MFEFEDSLILFLESLKFDEVAWELWKDETYWFSVFWEC